MNTANPIHHYALLFPEATADEKKALRESIDQNGLREEIVLLGNEILEGRTRYEACRELKIPPKFRQFDPVKDGQDPLQFVIDRNLNRRHLTTGQRAALGAELAKAIREKREAEEKKAAEAPPTNVTPITDNEDDLPDFLKKTGDGSNAGKPAAGRASEEAAKVVGTSPRSVETAEKLKKEAPKKFDEVKKGEKSLHKAAEEAKQELPGLTKDPVVSSYRAEAADMVEPTHGAEFAAAIRNDTILKDQQLREFMKLTIHDQQQIRDLVATGWKVKQAVKFAKGIFDQDDAIRELINLAIMRRGKAVAKVASHTILVLSQEELEASEGTFVREMIAELTESQAKPESTAPKIENSVGQAFENAKPASKPGKPAPKAAKPSAPGRSSGGSKAKTTKPDAAPKKAAKKAPKGKK